jgi:hypothetical protein
MKTIMCYFRSVFLFVLVFLLVFAYFSPQAYASYFLSSLERYRQPTEEINLAQLNPNMTIGELRKLLIDVLQELQKVLDASGENFKKVGESLEANITNIIAEIDRKYSHLLDKTIQSFSSAEKQFFLDASDLVKQTRDSAIKVEKVGGQEARKTIYDTDILSYNTLYSLPCREQIPRIVYVDYEDEGKVIVKNENSPFVRIKGNYFNIGPVPPSIFVDAVRADATVSNNEILVQIPESVLNTIANERLAHITFRLYSKKKRTIGPLTVPGCFFNTTLMDRPLEVGIILSPQKLYQINGYIEGNYEEVIPASGGDYIYREFPQGRHEMIDDNCDINESRTQEFNIPDDWEVNDTRHNTIDTWGSSYFERIEIIRNRVIVHARLIGQGYDIPPEVCNFLGCIPIPLGSRTCRGRARYLYDLTIIGRKQQAIVPEQRISRTLPKEEFRIIGNPGQTTFSGIRHSQANSNLENLRWYFKAEVKGTIGRRIIPPTQIDSNIPQANKVKSRMENGILSIEIQEP